MKRQMIGPLLMTLMTTMAAPVPLASFDNGQSPAAPDTSRSQVEAMLLLPDKPDAPAQRLEGKYPNFKPVWTNYDLLPAVDPPIPSRAEAQPLPAPNAVAEAQEHVGESPEIQKARHEVGNEMVSAFEVRQKAFEETIDTINAMLQTETEISRIQAYHRLLEDTSAGKKINEHVLEQFGDNPATNPEVSKPRPSSLSPEWSPLQ